MEELKNLIRKQPRKCLSVGIAMVIIGLFGIVSHQELGWKLHGGSCCMIGAAYITEVVQCLKSGDDC
jgi:hypothetical protein